ncbi:MAG TPA: hypothetical protein VMZ53_24935 [Kofleriaceae bacterium]|nr:hypothetical protein [Kofleriaceae bacterium]
MLVAALPLAACRASEAGPGSGTGSAASSGLSAPAGWKALPSLANAAHDAAKTSGLAVDSAEAWGETARGCYGTWLSLTTTRAKPLKLADEFVKGIETEPSLAGIALTEVVKPAATTDNDMLSLAFAKPPYRGKVRARLVNDGHITALVCFWNEREPAACEAACGQLLGGLK